MKSVLALCLFAAAAAAQYASAPVSRQVSGTTPIPIIRYNQNIREFGADSDFETGNGIKSQEDTEVVQGPKRVIDDGYGSKVESTSELKKTGSYSYTSPDGELISMSYTADADGFHATGSHIPTSPPMPAELKAAHDEANARPKFVESQEDSYAPAPVRSSYSAPAPVRMESSYSAPAPLPVRSQQYSAPVSTPEIRINYAPVRSTY